MALGASARFSISDALIIEHCRAVINRDLAKDGVSHITGVIVIDIDGTGLTELAARELERGYVANGKCRTAHVDHAAETITLTR